MGKRGPAPKPTALRILHGEPNKARINRTEPVPALVEIKPPTDLSAAARRVWRRYAPDLERKGVLTAWDIEHFAVWCDAAVHSRNAARHIADEGEVIDGARGGQVKNPWFVVWTQSSEVMSRYGARFGLTPSDRAQLSHPEPESDELERLLS